MDDYSAVEFAMHSSVIRKSNDYLKEGSVVLCLKWRIVGNAINVPHQLDKGMIMEL